MVPFEMSKDLENSTNNESNTTNSLGEKDVYQHVEEFEMTNSSEAKDQVHKLYIGSDQSDKLSWVYNLGAGISVVLAILVILYILLVYYSRGPRILVF
jgi:hypothetical protein